MFYEYKDGKHWASCTNPYTGQINGIKSFKTKRGCLNYIAKHNEY